MDRRPLLADPLPLFGFFTRLPIGTRAPLEAVVAAFPLVPVVGWVIGAFGAVTALVLGEVLPPLPLGAIVLAVVVGLTGLNQMDGLLDLGDGLMVHGDAARRLRVMHDHAAGVGAVGAVLVTYLLTFAALGSLAAERPAVLAAGVLTAEVLCRTPYLILAWRGRTSHEGLGSAFLEGFGAGHVLVGLAVTLPVLLSWWWLGLVPLVAAGALAGLTALVLMRTAHRLLGGVGGDVMGASQEITRALVLVALTVGTF